MEKYDISLREHLGAIQEITIRNELPALKIAGISTGLNFKVAGVYIEANAKVYSGGLNTAGRLKYSPFLQNKVFDLTERYLDTQRVKELNKLKI